MQIRSRASHLRIGKMRGSFPELYFDNAGSTCIANPMIPDVGQGGEEVWKSEHCKLRRFDVRKNFMSNKFNEMIIANFHLL